MRFTFAPCGLGRKGLDGESIERLLMRWDFLKSWFDPGTRRRARELQVANAKAIESVVVGTDPRLRMVSGYQKKLAPGVTRALTHAEAVAQQLPGPIEVSRKTFGADPRVRALFVSVDHLRETFAHSHVLRSFLTQPRHQGSGTCYALLAVDKSEKQTFGTELDTELVQKEVMQTVVNFSAHRFVAPAPDIHTLRSELVEQAFEHLVGCALRRIVSLRARSQELTERRLLLESKLRERLTRKRGLQETLFEVPTLDGTVTMEIRHHLADTDEELKAASVSLGTLNDYLGQIQDVLSHPENHLRLHPLTVRLDRSGVKRKADDPRPGQNVDFAEIHLGDEQSAVGILVSYSPKEFPPQSLSKTVFGD